MGRHAGEQRQRFLANIEAGATRMERLVARLLQLARIQHVRESSETVVVRDFFADLRPRYGDQVRFDVAADAPRAIAIPPDHLDAALHNVIDNAVRHGGGAAVEVAVGAAAGRLCVRVRDHGPGISPDNRARLFERFFTTERDRGGTGLGLAIVRAVAEARGGRVDVDSGPGGMTFTLLS
ncbi:MAG: HAMP domain-containing sensor histidine kinase [bacterium]